MRRVKAIVGTIGFLGLSFPAARAEAACCTGFTQQCAGSKSIWCVQNGAPAGTLPASFCPYGDEVVTELETRFNIQAPATFEFDVEWPPNHGAHTGTDCSTFGDGVTGDAFTGPGPGNVTGFWGYLLALHEAINDWTGLTSGGWPTDYWADHISGFPNEMDWRIMGTLGAKLNDANLIAASPAQKARFWPNGDGPPDSRVQMFDDIFVLPNMGNGYEGFSRIFGLIQADKLSWDSVATNGANPDERRSEYVAAYLSLGAGQSVLPIMQTPGPGYAVRRRVAGLRRTLGWVAGRPGRPCRLAGDDFVHLQRSQHRRDRDGPLLDRGRGGGGDRRDRGQEGVHERRLRRRESGGKVRRGVPNRMRLQDVDGAVCRALARGRARGRRSGNPGEQWRRGRRRGREQRREQQWWRLRVWK